MKKILSLVLSLFLLFMFAVNISAAESGIISGGSLTVGSVAALPGANVRIPVVYKNNPGFAASSIKIEFDKNVLVPVSTSVGTLSGYDITDNFGDGLYSANALVNASGDIKGDGILLYVEAKISDTAAPGKYPLTLSSEFGACNWNEDLLLTDYIDGVLTVLCSEHSFEKDVCTVCGARKDKAGAVTVENTTAGGNSVFEEEYKNSASDTTINSAVQNGSDEDGEISETDEEKDNEKENFFSTTLGLCIIIAAVVIIAAAVIIVLTRKKKN